MHLVSDGLSVNLVNNNFTNSTFLTIISVDKRLNVFEMISQVIVTIMFNMLLNSHHTLVG